MRVNNVVFKPVVTWQLDTGATNVRSLSSGTFSPAMTFRSSVFGAAAFADVVYAAEFDIAASGTQTFDLVGGSVSGFFGESLAAARLKGVGVQHKTTSLASSIKFGGGSAPVFGANFITPNLAKGGFFLMATPDATGWATTATTADILTITNNDSGTGHTASVVLFLLGGST